MDNIKSWNDVNLTSSCAKTLHTDDTREQDVERFRKVTASSVGCILSHAAAETYLAVLEGLGFYFPPEKRLAVKVLYDASQQDEEHGHINGGSCPEFGDNDRDPLCPVCIALRTLAGLSTKTVVCGDEDCGCTFWADYVEITDGEWTCPECGNDNFDSNRSRD